MRTRSEYQKALKKYNEAKILKMYRDNKINLTEKEWKNLHKRIDKKILLNIYKVKKINYKQILICFGIIILISTLSIGDYVDQEKYCNMIKGHTCTKYEIEKMGD